MLTAFLIVQYRKTGAHRFSPKLVAACLQN
uniref:Uncharacterized protein n=1 Tax=Anguilla anguilla TaxID=7936 RepID=A0A0E9Q2I8_ANGAN